MKSHMLKLCPHNSPTWIVWLKVILDTNGFRLKLQIDDTLYCYTLFMYLHYHFHELIIIDKVLGAFSLCVMVILAKLIFGFLWDEVAAPLTHFLH